MRTLTLLLHLLLPFLVATAQPSPSVGIADGDGAAAFNPLPTVPVNPPSFVRLGESRLLFPGDTLAFDSLFARLRHIHHTGQGTLHILHIGGSHVQAGHFTQELRSCFARLTPDTLGQRSLLFPWQALRSNGPTDYDITPLGTWERTRCVDREPSLPLGMSGAAIATTDSLAALHLQLTGADSARWAFTSLRLLAQADEGVTPCLLSSSGDTIDALPEPDSLGFLLHLPAPSCQATLCFAGLTQGRRIVLRGIMPDSDAPGIRYTECGVNGASLASWLKCSLLADELRTLCPPDLVVFGIGINDANVPTTRFDVEAFKQSYRTLMSRLREANPHVKFLFITNNDCWLRVGRTRGIYNRNTTKVEQAMIDLAREADGAVWNQFRVMGGYSSSQRWVNAHLMKRDHIHFLRPGYKLMADLLYNAFITETNKRQ